MMAALLAPSERTFVVLVSTTPKQGRILYWIALPTALSQTKLVEAGRTSCASLV